MFPVPRLVVLFGPKRGITRDFEGVLRIGRSAESDLQLIDERVSRDHCTLEVTPGGVVLRDLSSRNGTWLEGKKLTAPAVLTAGAKLSVGESLLAFEPELDALRSREGEITLVLTRQATATARRAKDSTEASLAQAGPLLRALGNATDERHAARLLAEFVCESLKARGAAVVRAGPNEVTRVLWGTPVGGQVTLPGELVQQAMAERRALSVSAEQTQAEVDEHTTRIHTSPGFVACAPLTRLSQCVGVISVERARDFDDAELELLSTLASVGAGALEPVRVATSTTRPVAESRAMRETLELAQSAARVRSTVLVTGETGAGKEALVRFIHDSSPRRAGPFVALNCGAISPELAESELFGHEKGAFTGAAQTHAGVFERADGGTLLLDEVAELPAHLQVKLLRVLQDRLVTRVGARTPFSVDVRLVAATHRDLQAAVKSGAFREDLYYRLNVVPLHLQPLRERADDVLPLAELFLAQLRREHGLEVHGLSAEARDALVRCKWPGNVRQLANALERAVVLKRGPGPIELLDLPPEVTSAPRQGGAAGRPLAELIAELEREQITLALHRARGVKTAAAEALGISRPTLDRKIVELKIELFSDKP